VLRIPHITLMADQRLLQIRMRDLADPGFNDFPQGTDAQDRYHDDIGEEPSLHFATSTKDFEQWQCEEKAKTEMHDTIKVIAVKVEERIQPHPERHFGIGVMRGNRISAKL